MPLTRPLACLLAACVCLGGCRSLSVTGAGERITAEDGFPLTALRFTLSPPPSAPPRALVLYLQGSEDRSVTDSMGALAGFCAMNAPVIAVERRGVSPDGTVDRAIAARYATRERRAADALAALEWGAKGARSGTPVVLVGASEGADVAAAVAARSPRITHVILLGGGGGWTQEEEFRHFIRTRGRCVGLHSERELDARIADIKANPTADTMWAGHPYSRWSGFMFERAADDLLGVDAPILVVHGDADESVPIESARALRDAFARANKPNLKLVELRGVDHSFHEIRTGKDQLPRVEVEIVRWLGGLGVLDPDEVRMFIARVREAHPDVFR